MIEKHSESMFRFCKTHNLYYNTRKVMLYNCDEDMALAEKHLAVLHLLFTCNEIMKIVKGVSKLEDLKVAFEVGVKPLVKLSFKYALIEKARKHHHKPDLEQLQIWLDKIK